MMVGIRSFPFGAKRPILGANLLLVSGSVILLRRFGRIQVNGPEESEGGDLAVVSSFFRRARTQRVELSGAIRLRVLHRKSQMC